MSSHENIFGSAPAPATREYKQPVFPGLSGDSTRTAPRGDHGRSIHDASVDLGGGYGSGPGAQRPVHHPKHLVRDDDVAAGSRQGDTILDQSKESGIFGNGGAGALRDSNAPAGPPSTAGMTGKERRDAIAAWRNAKAQN